MTDHKRSNVIFCTPTLDGRVSTDFMVSALQTQWLLIERGIPHSYLQVVGDCFVAKARNRLVSEFLQRPEATDLFFLDDDIHWPPAKVIEFLQRPEDVLAGIYPRKDDHLQFPVVLEQDPVRRQPFERDGLVRALRVPTGFLRIKRHVLEKLAAEAQIYQDRRPDGSVSEHYNIFEARINDDGLWCTEDYMFSEKWLAMGGEIWVDPNIAFRHRGTKSWSGNLSEALPI